LKQLDVPSQSTMADDPILYTCR